MGRCCLALRACVLLLAACGSERRDPPPIQESSTAAATAIVRVTRSQPFSARCVIIERGATVEWRNLTPHTAISMVSVREPFEISAPALAAPYNWVAPEGSGECAQSSAGVCLVPAPYSFWRHTFRSVGVFDYRDPSGGAGSGTTTYGYGLPPGTTSTATGTSTGPATGTVCVRGGLDGNECSQICCMQDSDCAPGVTCVSSRCGGVQ